MRPLPNPERAWERAAPAETQARTGIDLAGADIDLVRAEVERRIGPCSGEIEVLSGGLAASRVLELVGPRLAAKDYTPTGPAKFMHKDLSFVVESARSVGAAAPMASAGTELYAQLLAQGLGDLDLAVVRKAIANLSTTDASHSGTEAAKETAR